MKIKKYFLFFIFLLFIFSNAFAKRVKVGWADDYRSVSATVNNVKAGYYYDYLQALSRYAGWELEYVGGSRSALIEKLKHHEIDVMADLSYNPSWLSFAEYSETPILIDACYIYVPSKYDYLYPHLADLNGKKIGVIGNTSVTSEPYKNLEKWKNKTGINIQIVPFYGDSVYSSDPIIRMHQALKDGEIDGLVELNSHVMADSEMTALARVGESRYYVCVAKGKKDLLNDLQWSFSSLLAIDPLFTAAIYKKYYGDTALTKTLSIQERSWLKEHNELNIGYIENYAPFSHTKTDNVSCGVFKEILETGFEKYNINFNCNYLGYDNYYKMVHDLNSGRLDIIFPIYANDFRIEELKFMQTKSVITSPMFWVYKDEDNADYTKNGLKIAIRKATPLQGEFIEDIFPSRIEKLYFTNWEECLKAVESGVADGLVLNTYRASILIRNNVKLKKLKLPEQPSLTYGINKNQRELMSIVNRIVSLFGEAEISDLLLKHTEEVYKYTFRDVFKDHPVLVMIFVFVIAGSITFLIVFLLLKSKQKKILMDLAHRDSMTGLLNRRSYDEDFSKLSGESLDKNFVFASIDIDELKSTNDNLGHAAGDELVKATASIVQKVIGPYGKVYRSGGDEFICIFHADRRTLDRINSELKKQASEWHGKFQEKLSISCGFVSKREFLNATLTEIAKLADERMYKEKYSDSIRLKTKSGNFKNVSGYEKFFSNKEDSDLLKIFVSAYESQYDTLTGLPSMSYFLELIQSKDNVIYKDYGTPVIISFNLNGLKGYNTKYGMSSGDNLIRFFSETIAESFGKKGCARFGEDRFYAVTKDVDLEERMDIIFKKLANYNNGKTLTVRCGIYIFDAAAIIYPSLACDRARIACDYTKNVYESSFTYFDASMAKSYAMRDFIIGNIDKALEEGHIQVYYQPQVDASSGLIKGFEALARWNDPARGMISPGEFIPILEDCSLTYKIDEFVLETVAKDMVETRAKGITLIPVSFNISRTDFVVSNPYDALIRVIEKYDLAKELFKVEITESSVMSDPLTMKNEIKRFRESGFDVLMDDFGSGYSSLSTLRDFDFDEIKIDMGFMMNFSNKSQNIVSSMIWMASHMGITTLCEGVETADQREFLKSVGCDLIQGYFFGQPAPKEQVIEKWLK